MEPGRRETGPPGMSFAAIAPGLVIAVGLDLIALAGWSEKQAALVRLSPLVLVGLPWVTLLVLRRSPAALGYIRHRAVARFGWGVLAGALWRGASLALNLWWAEAPDRLGAGLWDWLGGLIWVPFVEETFYRGYLGLGLQKRCGRLGAVVLQALLFTLHPVHWSQGFPHLVSVFGFGLLAGALVARTGSIWPAWGAHAMANVLPAALTEVLRG